MAGHVPAWGRQLRARPRRTRAASVCSCVVRDDHRSAGPHRVAPRGQHVSVGRTPRALSERRLHSVALPLEKESREERGKETSKDVGKGNAAAGTCAVEHSGSLLIGSSAPLGTGPAPAPRTPAAARRWGAEWRFSFCFQWQVTHCVSELGDQKSPRLTHRRCRSDPAV